MFSAMQATAQELHPEHFFVLITMIQFRWFTGFFEACWMSSCMACSSAVLVGAERSIRSTLLLWDAETPRCQDAAGLAARHLRKKKETDPGSAGQVSFANSLPSGLTGFRAGPGIAPRTVESALSSWDRADRRTVYWPEA